MPWNFSLKIVWPKFWLKKLIHWYGYKSIIVMYTWIINCIVLHSSLRFFDSINPMNEIKDFKARNVRMMSCHNFGCQVKTTMPFCQDSHQLDEDAFKIVGHITWPVKHPIDGRSQRLVTGYSAIPPSFGCFSQVTDHRDDGKKDTHRGATIQDTLCKNCLGSCINVSTKKRSNTQPYMTCKASGCLPLHQSIWNEISDFTVIPCML